jgi:hypothetical protein
MGRRPKATQSPPGIGPASMPADVDEVEITASKETWSEYTLKDGTVIRLRPVLAGAFRSRSQYNAEGEPIYGVRTAVIPDVRVSPALRRKGKQP